MSDVTKAELKKWTKYVKEVRFSLVESGAFDSGNGKVWKEGEGYIELKSFFEFNNKSLLNAFFKRFIEETDSATVENIARIPGGTLHSPLRVGKLILTFSQGTKASQPLVKQLKKALASYELTEKKSWLKKQHARIFSNKFNSVAEVETRQRSLRFMLVNAANDYSSDSRSYDRIVNHNAKVRPIEYHDEGGVESRYDGATRWVPVYKPYYVGTNDRADKAPQRDDNWEEFCGKVAKHKGEKLVNMVDQALSHKNALEHARGGAIKQFLATQGIDKDLKKIYNSFAKMDAKDLNDPQRILENLRETKLLYSFS